MASDRPIAEERVNRDFLVLVPPTQEQDRIVAKVDELMAVCDQLEAQIAAGVTIGSHLLDARLHEALDTTAAVA